MDQHPIPQDVTGFQFKLIGTMTVKQFGYVAVGAVSAVILYYLPFNSPFGILIKLLLIPILGASGVVIAFVPIEGRPIDVMTSNFVKALFAPNQYIYRRQGRKMSFSLINITSAAAATAAAPKGVGQAAMSPVKPASEQDAKQEKLRAFLLSSQGGVKNELDKKEASFLKSFTPVVTPSAPAGTTSPVARPAIAPTKPPVSSAFSASPTAAPTPLPSLAKPPAPQPLVAQKPITPTTQPTVAASMAPAPKETADSLAQKEAQLEQELVQAKQEEAKPQEQAAHDAAHQKVETLAKQIEVIHSQKVQLEQELAKLQVQLSQQKGPTMSTPPAPQPMAAPASATPTAAPSIPIQDPNLIKVVAKAPADKRTDIPKVSDTPNVVVGIVKDPRGNVLSNILVEVKDKSGNPVRAFKTNPLGQFASATPLSPGVYTIELEDPKKQQNFDLIQITANNEIMRPIEIISHDAREALRQQLFS